MPTRPVVRTVTLPPKPTFKELYQLFDHEWAARPTLHVGQTHDLKYDDGQHRVWMSRLRPEDYDVPEPARKQLDERRVIERFEGGRWITLDRYGRVAQT
jgi:hypothetical protein